MKNSIIIVTFQSARTLSECLSSVIGTMGDEDEIIIVDNASADGTLDICSRFTRRDARIHLVINTENAGYTKGVNQGIALAKGEILIFLNPDTEVFSGWLNRFEEVLSDHKIGAVGPVSDVVAAQQFVGHYISGSISNYAEFALQISEGYAGKTIETKLLIGFCMATRRDVIDKLGMLDERMVLGADDLEFSWRLRENGYKLRICLDVFVRHHSGVSFAHLGSERKHALIRQSDLALKEKLKKHYGDISTLTSHDLWGCDIFEPVLRED